MTNFGKHQYSAHNHPIERFIFANATTRAAGTPNGLTLGGSAYTIVADDIGQIAFQSDTETYWRLTGVGPIAWVQVSGSGIAPGGSAGGDLTGTYPNPTLVAAGPGATGPLGDGTHVAVVTIDAKGRVIALSSTAITGAAPSGSAGGDLAGTYPNPTLASAVLAALDSVMSSTATAAAQRTALGLGSAALSASTAFDAAGAAATAQSASQPLDSDLTTIAGLTATTDSILQSKSSAWAARTLAQVAADLQGTSSTTLAAGNDSRLSDTRTPTDGTVTTAKIVDANVTLAKIASIATARILGNNTGSSAAPVALTGVQAAAVIASYNNAGNSSTAITIDWSTATVQKVTMTGNCTFTFSNPTAGSVYVLQLLQDGTGSRTVTWPGTVKWSGGTAPTLTTTAAKTDIFTLMYDGTSYFAVTSGLNF